MKILIWLPLVVILYPRDNVLARTWKDVDVMHGLSPLSSDEDFMMEIQAFLTESDPLSQQVLPSVEGTTAPSTFVPTGRPTSSEPSAAPSISPTSAEPTTAEPTTAEPTTAEPTSSHPSSMPSGSPSEEPDLYPFNEPPLFPDPWYFNYDTRPNARYGPGYAKLITGSSGFSTVFENNKWATSDVDVTADPNYYWKEFAAANQGGFGTWVGTLANRLPFQNQCGRVGLQSPINVIHNGFGTCDETHEIRSLPGDFKLNSDKVKKEIHGNKLRFRYQRRPCADLNAEACKEPDPPRADFPNGWGGFADSMHVDFKVPSEHLINGVRYDAELQIFHLHPGRRRMPSTATLIRATDDGFNWYFDEALQAFEFEFYRDSLLCASKQRRERRLRLAGQVNDDSFNTTTSMRQHNEYNRLDQDIPMESERFDRYNNSLLTSHRRRLQNGIWDPHHHMVQPSIHFYRYDGSLTEPPCGEWVTWFVTDKAFNISFDQLAQLKNILFNHVDHNCRRTSVHYEESVARPVQETMNRPVSLCTELDFGPDP